MTDEPTGRRQRIVAALADPTIDGAMRAELMRARELYDALAAHLSPEAAERHFVLVEIYCTDPRGCIRFDEPSDLAAWQAQLDGASRLLATPSALARLSVADREATHRLAFVMQWRIATYRPGRTKGRGRAWHAVTVVAVCRALWLRWKGREAPRQLGSGDQHAFLDFLGDLFAVLDVRTPDGKAASPRGQLASWRQVADTPELDFDFGD
ncbi:MAG: hypothetical protein EA355_15750 [Rhodobacteraceae bacterium]|nr:MAG: hypothetical protein EA355_15750 [Paracoccaceae bacterium]